MLIDGWLICLCVHAARVDVQSLDGAVRSSELLYSSGSARQPALTSVAASDILSSVLTPHHHHHHHHHQQQQPVTSSSSDVTPTDCARGKCLLMLTSRCYGNCVWRFVGLNTPYIQEKNVFILYIIIYRDGLPVRRQSPIQVDSDPTGSGTDNIDRKFNVLTATPPSIGVASYGALGHVPPSTSS